MSALSRVAFSVLLDFCPTFARHTPRPNLAQFALVLDIGPFETYNIAKLHWRQVEERYVVNATTDFAEEGKSSSAD